MSVSTPRRLSVAETPRPRAGRDAYEARRRYMYAAERLFAAVRAELASPDPHADGATTTSLAPLVHDLLGRRAGYLAACGGSASDDGDGVSLTRREMEILALVADGRSTADIAARLFLSRATVRNHIARALRGLGAHSRVEAVALARSRGLL